MVDDHRQNEDIQEGEGEGEDEDGGEDDDEMVEIDEEQLQQLLQF